ncbi:hypothetical protein SAMN02910298_01396 [Pseudobutyrivibrio sp. YE44]|uniref:hypothetical protein n=1 Tax=Pseudobutyrivibrio sp. YE44 TaxID=1520802 RepID=UPI0008849427|nr:hypothetical protein [Pseudobutyrivibrio sp. YE44]SDB28775.1 hypothetical protein SAMN02910298_01396 [Pseudobutyrivibrio sp. YE44]
MKCKRILAVAMATTLVFAMSITAFAEDTEPVTTGTTTGAGTSEGHVNQKKIDVILPTEVAASTFAYTMDPERLIATTSGGKWTASSFPTGTDDKGVYFAVGKVGGDGADKDNTRYAATSTELTVTNKSSHKINLTVKAETVAGAKDIPLVAKADLTDPEEAGLYLGLIVGSETAVALSETEAVSKTVEIAGTPGNYKIAPKADKSGYEYRVLTLAEYQTKTDNSSATEADFLNTWAKTTFKLEGETTTGKEIESDTTAPSIKVTWSYEDPEASTPATIELLTGGDGTTYVAAAPEGGFTTTLEASKITSVKANNVDVTAKASIGRNMIIVSWPDIKTALDISSFADIDGGKLNMEYVYDGTTYKGTYTP